MPSIHPIERKISRSLRDNDLLERANRLLLGVSGGSDSMAMLNILAALQGELALALVAVYVDHGLRPQETAVEQELVAERCKLLGVDCEIVVADVAGFAEEKKISLEHAARDLRYRAFDQLAVKYQTDRTVVAHTADDQVEEVLIRLLRGGSRKALSGMRMKNKNLIRPLLDTSKTALLGYLKDKGIPYCHDSSNDDQRFLRNRIRHHLLPLLEKEYDSGIRQALLKTAANLRADDDLLEGLMHEAWGKVITETEPGHLYTLNRKIFVSFHSALQRRLIERLLWHVGSSARYEHILTVIHAAVAGRSGSELHLSKGLRVGVYKDSLTFSYPHGKGPWRGRLHST